ncbi:hypothetical protein AVEN_268795-1 [Araneus ventricosus]|uniref:Uncharacterized protein n=1 Tax=Araneus ventricosus TaxID=182803 RepID=A0A4Y2UKK1_ARAVE|nr:hypothetical protein AVEN_268795-1 [Araneus ventricosus]
MCAYVGCKSRKPDEGARKWALVGKDNWPPPTTLISELIEEPHLPSEEAKRLRQACVVVKEKFVDRPVPPGWGTQERDQILKKAREMVANRKKLKYNVREISHQTGNSYKIRRGKMCQNEE